MIKIKGQVQSLIEELMLVFKMFFSSIDLDPRERIHTNNQQQRVRHSDRTGYHSGRVHREGAQRPIQIQAASSNPHRGYHGMYFAM